MSKRRANGQCENTEKLNAEVLAEDRKEHYRKARQFTAGIVFFPGNGMLDEDVLSEVWRRNEVRTENVSRITRKKKAAVLALQLRVNAIKIIFGQKGFKPKHLKVPQFKYYCKWKKQPGNQPFPTKKADLLNLFQETKCNPSPQVSPCNSDVEYESDNDDVDISNMDSDASAADNDDLLLASDGEEEGKDEIKRYEMDDEEESESEDK